jgi:hypothetical protein
MGFADLIDMENETASNVPPTDQLIPSEKDLINLFFQQQINKYGWNQIELWYAQGFEIRVIGNKVMWVT